MSWVLYYVTELSVVDYHAILCNRIQYVPVDRIVVQSINILYNSTIQYSTIKYSMILCITLLYSTENTVQYSTVMYTIC